MALGYGSRRLVKSVINGSPYSMRLGGYGSRTLSSAGWVRDAQDKDKSGGSSSVSNKSNQQRETSRYNFDVDKALQDSKISGERRQHIKKLQKYYPPELLRSILVAENSVKPSEFEKRKPNNYEFGLEYLDDLAELHPTYDYIPADMQTRYENMRQPIPRFVPPGYEQAERLGDLSIEDVIGVPMDPSRKRELEYRRNIRDPEYLKEQYQRALAGENVDLASLKNAASISRIIKEDDPDRDLALITGFDQEYLRRNVKCIGVYMRRVRNQTNLGKKTSFYVICVAGDGNGLLGVGEGKSLINAQHSLRLARIHALKSLKPVKRYDNRTIFAPIRTKYHAVEMWLKPAREGHGLRVNPYIWQICRLCGIKDLSGKVFRSRNPMNILKSTYNVLTNQTTPDEIAIARGKNIVDVRQAYFQ